MLSMRMYLNRALSERLSCETELSGPLYAALCALSPEARAAALARVAALFAETIESIGEDLADRDELALHTELAGHHDEDL